MRIRRQTLLSLATAAALLAGCGSDETHVTVMTRNLYLGADLTPAFFAATPQDLLEVTTAIWAMVNENDFTDRAKALAAEIAAEGPDLVGLQEVALWRTQSPSDGPTTQATTVAFDFLARLLSELSARGLTYTAVETLELSDVELPVVDGATLMDVRFTDRDVILAREGVSTSSPQGTVYATLLSVGVAGTTLTVRRGFTRVSAAFGGQPITFVNTHLEAESGAVRTAQAAELVASLEQESGRVILVGDLNSLPGSQGHLAATTAGFTDAWSATHGQAPGLTCCWPADLSLTTPPLDKRIDLVLTRGALRPSSATIVGDETADRTAAGRWPSDHAGLAATVEVR